jgi:copper chaperone NosL
MFVTRYYSSIVPCPLPLAPFLIALVLTLVGCKENLDEPPKIRWGEEVCAHCNMIISDKRFAAAITLKSGEVRKYDDLGCLLKEYSKYSGEIHRVWVHRYDGESSGRLTCLHTCWLDARQACFVQSPSIQSPMGSGIAAVDAGSHACEKLASETKGKVLSFDQLLKFDGMGQGTRGKESERQKRG